VSEQEVVQSGCDLIVAERHRQITSEGWDESHDDSHADGGLALAAAVYATPSARRHYGWHGMPQGWPWDAHWFKPDTRIRELVKAGALIAAEIDRLQRLEAAP